MGFLKGKRLKECGAKDLQKTKEYFLKKPPLSAQARELVEMIDKHLETASKRHPSGLPPMPEPPEREDGDLGF